MLSKRSKITDMILIILICIIALLLSVNGFFHYSIKKRIYEDSYFINQLGLIRGNIQRYAKFKLIGNNNADILLDIEMKIKNVSQIISQYNYSKIFYEMLSNKLNIIKNEFSKLKIANTQKEIIDISEKLWIETNDLIKSALEFHKYKFNTAIKTFNFIIYSTVIILFLITLFVYKKVKMGLEIETITDRLTGLYNRLYFNEIYSYFIEKYQRDKKPFSMLILDIDNFKRINDTYGHATGDEVLKKIGSIINNSIRKTDFAFRYGGEELVVIFPETKIDDAQEISKRILQSIPKKIKINLESITVSGGLGEYKGENPKKFFEKVDNSLYIAKKTGKNKIVKI